MTDRLLRRAEAVGLASAWVWAWVWAGPITTIIRPARLVRPADPGLLWAAVSVGPAVGLADPAADVPAALAAAEATAVAAAAAADLLF